MTLAHHLRRSEVGRYHTTTNLKRLGWSRSPTRSFAVQVPVVEFQGFNAPLQREHFNENYMVSTTWPNITFAGRIIESIDLSVPGRYSARAKGDLVVHGVTKERIVPCEVVVTSDGIRIHFEFRCGIGYRHGIRIPSGATEGGTRGGREGGCALPLTYRCPMSAKRWLLLVCFFPAVLRAIPLPPMRWRCARASDAHHPFGADGGPLVDWVRSGCDPPMANAK